MMHYVLRSESMDTDVSFGRWLKRRRKTFDTTQAELAARVGCATDTLRKIEAGALRPSRQIAERLADLLAIPPDERAIFIQRARGGAQATYAGRSPYVGLNTFQDDDAAFFFGREELVAALVEQARDERFLAVLGPSGSGKSSVVLAGLLPALRRGALPGSELWRYLTLRPGARPLDALAAALEPIDNPFDDAQGGRRPRTANGHLVTLPKFDGERLVLVVDQFEELWTQAPAEPLARAAHHDQQQRPFIEALLAAARDHSILVILTMRADFLHRAAEHAGLARALGEHDLIVSPMAPDELRRAIECPAQVAGAMFEPGLVDELIAQAAGRVGALPLLEYTLLELWNARRSDGTLTWAAFHALGGVEGALAARADATLTEHYTPAQQDDLRHLLVRLVQPGEHTTDTRRRALLADLAPAGSSVDVMQSLLAPLVDARLLAMSEVVTDDTPDPSSIWVELAHEALIRAWPTFSRWIGAAREDVRFQLQLEQAAKEWQAGGENGDLLWSGLRLDRAAEWLARAQPRLNERDQCFLQASRERA